MMKRSRRVFLTMMGVAAITAPLAVTSAMAQPAPLPVPPPPPPPVLLPDLPPLGRRRRRLGAGG